MHREKRATVAGMSDTNIVTPLALTGVKVTSEGGLNYKDVQLAIEGDTITIRTAGGLVLGTRDAVLAVDHPGVDVWHVTFAAGEDRLWTITKGGCGCMGR